MEKKVIVRQISLPENWAVDWELDRKLGAGSYSTVWRAVRRDRPGIDAAIKIISIPSSPAEAAALLAEGMTAAQGQRYYDEIAGQYAREIELLEKLKGTPHIVSIEDYKVQRKTDEIGNDIFIRMELLTPLDSILRRRVLTEQEIIRAGLDLCSALELCEAENIIHRDIKPANIFVNNKTKGRAFYKLGDFGIARSLQTATSGLSAKGTPSHMAPEVFFGKRYDNRADIYSLGITLYRLLNNNRLPFVSGETFSAADREAALSRRLSGEELPAPGRGSEGLRQIVLKACAYDPEKRYRTAAQMKKALENLPRAEGGTDAVTDAGDRTADRPIAAAHERIPEETKKKRTGLWVALAAVLLIGLAAWGLLSRSRHSPDSELITPTPEKIVITPTLSDKLTPTVSLTPTITPTSTPIPTPTATPTLTPTPAPTATPTATSTPTPTAEPDAAPAAGSFRKIGSIVTFGRYEQDHNTENGPEEIEWIVLDVQKGKSLLISRYGLDRVEYDALNREITWETCSLRNWLNHDFLEAAFTPEEQSTILMTQVDNSRNQGCGEWDTNGGNKTLDKLFLLSYHEAFELYFSGDEARMCTLADRTKVWWWLRSPGLYQDRAAYVQYDGSRSYYSVGDDNGCIRPALWLNLQAVFFDMK